MLCLGFGGFDSSHLFERQLASQFEAHHHHTSNPEEQDVVARLQQSAGVEHVQVLGLRENHRQKTTVLIVISHVTKSFPQIFFSSFRTVSLAISREAAELYLIRPSEDGEGENAR